MSNALVADYTFVEETEDDLQAELAELEANKSKKSQWIKFAIPHTDIRILPAPAEWGLKTSIYSVREHFVDLKEQGWSLSNANANFSFQCPESNGTGHCPVCALGRSGMSLREVDTRLIKLQDRYYANVLNVANPEKGVFRAALPKSVYEAIVGMATAKGAPKMISSLTEGVVFRVKRQGTGIKDTRYTVVDLKPFPIPVDDMISVYMPDMENLAKFPRQLNADLRTEIEELIAMIHNVDVSESGGRKTQRRALSTGNTRTRTQRPNLNDDDITY